MEKQIRRGLEAMIHNLPEISITQCKIPAITGGVRSSQVALSKNNENSQSLSNVCEGISRPKSENRIP